MRVLVGERRITHSEKLKGEIIISTIDKLKLGSEQVTGLGVLGQRWIIRSGKVSLTSQLLKWNLMVEIVGKSIPTK